MGYLDNRDADNTLKSSYWSILFSTLSCKNTYVIMYVLCISYIPDASQMKHNWLKRIQIYEDQIYHYIHSGGNVCESLWLNVCIMFCSNTGVQTSHYCFGSVRFIKGDVTRLRSWINRAGWLSPSLSLPHCELKKQTRPLLKVQRFICLILTGWILQVALMNRETPDYRSQSSWGAAAEQPGAAPCQLLLFRLLKITPCISIHP